MAGLSCCTIAVASRSADAVLYIDEVIIADPTLSTDPTLLVLSVRSRQMDSALLLAVDVRSRKTVMDVDVVYMEVDLACVDPDIASVDGHGGKGIAGGGPGCAGWKGRCIA